MKTIINYVKEEKRTFKELPFNDVDSLVLCAISYYDFDGIVPKLFSSDKIALKDINYNDNFIKELPDRKKYKELYQVLLKSPRFKDILMDNYYERESLADEVQFKALTFESDDFIYICFMGTKACSMISWKEDFMLSYMDQVPSHKLALKYLNRVFIQTTKKIYIGGHSKGGNLAIYSSMNTFILNRLRIRKIFNHDGPGFNKKIYNSKRYSSIKSKISKTVVSNSIVGMLLNCLEEYKVVKANGIGIQQHSPLSWAVKDGSFIYLKETNWTSKHIDKTVSTWIDSMTDTEKLEFTNALFSMLDKAKFDGMNIPNRKYFKMINTFRKGLKHIDEETRNMIVDVLKKLIMYEKDNIFNSNK